MRVISFIPSKHALAGSLLLSVLGFMMAFTQSLSLSFGAR
jgi:hypothetical protein